MASHDLSAMATAAQALHRWELSDLCSVASVGVQALHSGTNSAYLHGRGLGLQPQARPPARTTRRTSTRHAHQPSLREPVRKGAGRGPGVLFGLVAAQHRRAIRV